MPILGAHMSIAGGYYKAVEAAANCEMSCVQLFTKNNNQWRAKPISEGDVRLFTEALKNNKISHPISHASYLINLATANKELRAKSVDAMVIELERAEMLRIPYVIVHPGSYVEGTELQGLKRIVTAVNQVHRKAKGIAAKILLETTAGQGTSLGCKFEHLRHVLENIRAPERVDVCLDTCHVFAAGYPLAPRKEYRGTMQEFDDLIGVGRIKAFHLNDSKKPFGSRVDRHEHIGRGHLGEEPFAHLLKDRRFKKVPMYLETPKGDEDGTDLDKINLATLRRLAGK